MDRDDLQEKEDAYLKKLNQKLHNGTQPLAAVGDWDWPGYGINEVSAVVLGHRHPDSDPNQLEVVYLVTISSDHPIPNAGEVMRESGTNGSSYTFIQLAASVGSDGYQTQLLSTYVGLDPYAMPAPLRPSKRGKRAPARVERLEADPPPTPHPPP